LVEKGNSEIRKLLKFSNGRTLQLVAKE